MSATLASLRIRNLALVEDLTWEPPPGFIAVTGETGAGKSIILGALNLLLGERGDKGAIRSGADTCTVEAVFENVPAGPITALLEEHGAEPCEEGRLLLKRTLAANAAGRQFANGSPCTLALFRELGDLLVDLHGPHDHQSLFSRERQTRLLDRFAGCEEARARFSATRRELLRLCEERDSLTADDQAVAREIDLLAHQVTEIEQAQVGPGEEEDLLARQRAAENFQRIHELSGRLAAGISEDENSLLVRLTEFARLARDLAKLDPSAAGIAAACEAAFANADDLSRAVQSHAACLEGGPADLAALEERLDVLQGLRRKYGPTLADVAAFHAAAAEKLAALRGRTERRGTLDAEIAAAENGLQAAGAKLSTARRSAAKKLSEKVRGGLADLGFPKCDFSIGLETLSEATPHGFEIAEFLFSPNPGESPRPLRTIASSGEISRVMLALKSTLADHDDVPVLVFDEIDANVGGEIATKVGRKMQELGRARQVLCITHLPQVAALAASQVMVTKHVQGSRTRTLLEPVDGAGREEELARMLGGKSASALAHARALLRGDETSHAKSGK